MPTMGLQTMSSGAEGVGPATLTVPKGSVRFTSMLPNRSISTRRVLFIGAIVLGAAALLWVSPRIDPRSFWSEGWRVPGSPAVFRDAAVFVVGLSLFVLGAAGLSRRRE